ncbi:MAG: putative bifunctional diguanylate cyclase/phosphodiesterase, partial [Jatrophihabitans sp.]
VDAAAGLLVRRIRSPRGQLSAVELSVADQHITPLPLGGWGYPAEPGQLSWSPELVTMDGAGGGLATGPAGDHGAQASTNGAVAGLDGSADQLNGAFIPTGGGSAHTASLLLPDVPAFLSGIRELFRGKRTLRDLRLVDRDAEKIRTIRLYGWLPDPEPGTKPIGVTIDITELTGLAEESGRFFEALISVAPDTVMVLDVLRSELLWSNRRLAAQLGYPADRLNRYSDIRRAVHWSDREQLDDLLEQVRTGDELSLRELRFRIRDGAGRWRWMHLWLTPWLSGPSGSERADGMAGLEHGTVEQIVATIRDVDETVRAEQRLQWEARHDPLTGLANRRVINETLQKVADDLDDPRRFVYFLDLDDFRRVNDALGHSAGDELLRTLAARITVLVQPADVVGRFGGDELIIVSSIEPGRLAGRLLAAVRARTMLAGSEFIMSCSIGAATVGAAELPGDVIRRSNEAMYRAKRAGRDRFEVAGPLNSGPAQQRVELEASLRRAVSESSPELDMAFQPIVDRDLVPVAAEALLRWRHPTRGPLLPAEFLPIAESAGLMSDLGTLIMRRSVTAAAAWAAAGHPLLVSVNVGSRQLGNGRLEQLLIPLLERTGTPPELLCLEVTESVLVDADSPELAELVRLRELGLQIALDDFGTGYSPLTYIKRLPATTVKLDKSFVAGLGLPVPNQIDLAIARSVLQLATDIGMQVVAEGVETEQQMRLLCELGYELFQGFWAYPPMPADQLGALLAQPDIVRGHMA